MVNYLLKICFIILALGVIANGCKISLAKEGLGVPTSDYAVTRVPHTPSADPPPSTRLATGLKVDKDLNRPLPSL